MKKATEKRAELHRITWYINPTVNQIPESGGFLLPSLSGATPNQYTLNATLQGVDVNQRVGNQIKEVGLRIKGNISQTVGNVNKACGTLRTIIVRDHDNKGSPPALSDILEFTGSASDAIAIGSLVNWGNRKRFTFLYDQTLPIAPGFSGASDSEVVINVDINIPLSKVLTMTLNTRDAASINDGGIYCYFIYCNQFTNPVGAELPFFSGVAAFHFIDV